MRLKLIYLRRPIEAAQRGRLILWNHVNCVIEFSLLCLLQSKVIIMQIIIEAIVNIAYVLHAWWTEHPSSCFV